MSRTKTNRRTDREQYTRSNAATARLLTLVKSAETLALDWPNKNERRDVNNHIAEHHLQTKHQIDWDSATCITYSTDYYQRLTLESWFTNLEQTPLNRLIWRIQAKLTTRERLQLTNWLTTTRNEASWYYRISCLMSENAHDRLTTLRTGKDTDKCKISFIISPLLAELSRAKRASGAAWVNKWSNLPIRENLVITWPYTDRPPERPSVRPTGMPM